MPDLLDQFHGRTFTIGGKTYTAPLLGYQDGLRIKTATEAVEQAQRDGTTPEQTISDEDYLRMMLGHALDQMRADNVPPTVITWAAMISHAHCTKGPQVADELEARGPSPEVLAADMAATSGTATNRATRRAAAHTTQPPASGTGTTTARKANPNRTRSAGHPSPKPGR